MRTWFEERTGLKDSTLGDNMDRIDQLLQLRKSSIEEYLPRITITEI